MKNEVVDAGIDSLSCTTWLEYCGFKIKNDSRVKT